MSMEKDKDEIVAKLAEVWNNWIVNDIPFDDERNTKLLIGAIVQSFVVHGVTKGQQ